MKQQTAIIDSTAWLTPTILGIRLVRPDGRSFFSWQPGQYASLNFPDHRGLNGFRSFSIASSPTHPNLMDFGIRVHGPYTSALRLVQPGDRATVQGPFGKFTTRDLGNRPVVLLAGGIGVTPFMSMVRAAADLRSPTSIALLFSNRTLTETPYREELLELEKRHPNFRVTFAVSNQTVDPNTPRTIAGMLSGDNILSIVGDSFWASAFFLCGPAPFMNAMEHALTSAGIDRRMIRTESFSVKPGAIFEPGSPWPKLVLAGWGGVAAIALGVIVTQSTRQATSTTSVPLPSNTSNPGSPTNVQPAALPIPTNTGSAANTNTISPLTTTPVTTVTPTPIKSTPIQPAPQTFRPRATQS